MPAEKSSDPTRTVPTAPLYPRLEIPQWFSLAVVAVIFAMWFFYARIHGPAVIDQTLHTLKEGRKS